MTAPVTTAQRTWTTGVIAVVGLTAWMCLCDRYFHVDTDTVVHFWRPFIGAQTVWVVLTFALGALGLVTTAPLFAASQARPLRLALELVVMTAIYAISGFVGDEHGGLVTALFVGFFAARVAASRERAQVLTVAALLAVTGPLFESLTWKLGMFEYTQPDIIGVPWWLFALYANGAWATRELGALLKRG